MKKQFLCVSLLMSASVVHAFGDWLDFDNMMQGMEQRVRAAFGDNKRDLIETDAHFILKINVPGYSKDDIHIDVSNDGRMVTVSAQQKQAIDEKDEAGTYIRKERSSQSFRRVETLPYPVLEEGTTAQLKDGVLTITLPKRPQADVKRGIVITD